MVSASSSSAGLGNPASTVPSILTGSFIEPGISLPFLSLLITPMVSSLPTTLCTELFELSLNISPISEKLGIRLF
jgi:hypothetical protein